MTIALFLTLIAAIVGAFNAAFRTYLKLRVQAPAPCYPGTVQEATVQEANQPRLQPDLDSDRSESIKAPETSPVSEPSAPSSVASSEPSKSFEASMIVVPPIMPITEAEIPLATSLKITDVVEPPTVEPGLSIGPKPEERHHYSVMEEVGQLEHIDETLDQLTQGANDPDHLVRLAVAVELGELAKQGQALDRVRALLNQLMQDANVEVQVQAGASITMMPVEMMASDLE